MSRGLEASDAAHQSAQLAKGDRRELSPGVRAGLNAARAVSALYVVAHHVLAAVDAPKPLDIAFSFGQEAVLVFFLLSGFLIFANEQARALRPRGYYLRRLRRIYPPILAAMCLSTAAWALGLIPSAPTWPSMTATLFSVQDISFLKPGVISDPYLGNSPLWSLSYEIAFYALFPPVMMAWRRSNRYTRHAVGLVACLGYVSYLLVPNHFSLVLGYFLLWWAGAMAAKVYLDGAVTVRALLPEFAWLATLIGIAAVGVGLHSYEGLGVFPVLMLRHFVFGAVLLLILCTPARSVMARWSERVSRPAAVVASFSFGLYVLHYPILVQTGAVGTIWFFPALALTVALAWVVEIKLVNSLPPAPKH